MLFPSADQIGALPAKRAWRGVIAEDAVADVPVKIGRQVDRLGVLRQIERPEIRLRVGIDRLGRRGNESDLLPIRAERETADVHRNSGDQFGLAAFRRDRVKLRFRQFVIGFVHMPRSEINLRAVVRPNGIAFIETAVGELAWFDFLVGAPRRRHDPEMTRAFRIEVTLLVVAINRVGDDVDVAFMFFLRRFLFLLRSRCRRGGRAFRGRFF